MSDYVNAKRRLNQLASQYPSLREPQITAKIGTYWNEAYEKDSTGTQCLRFVEDLAEQMAPMKGGK